MGQSDDRGAVYRATIDDSDPRVRMWAFRAFMDCALEYSKGATAPRTGQHIKNLESNTLVDAKDKVPAIAWLARDIERCKGFANTSIEIPTMIAFARKAEAEGALSASAALHLRYGGQIDTEQRRMVAAQVVTANDGDFLTLDFAGPYLIKRLIATQPSVEQPLAEAAYAQAVCQIVDYCTAPSNYLRYVDMAYQQQFVTVDEAHRTLFPSPSEQQRLQALTQQIRIALLKGNLRFFGLGG